ncbi:MAG: aryl-sulfate sulfotransferase [Altibacter sp.]|uniref:aryl-sulfate sulfotransferase n=1 Tax=Altibacter sp. TaxID=2024823 RepID=UPI001D7FA0FC|nr:aryl-sulfate sulfotransferase [Altibacter sp.]MBZ0327337.1 aryl-sulfate sulfotransferase [Altibacter sp.]
MSYCNLLKFDSYFLILLSFGLLFGSCSESTLVYSVETKLNPHSISPLTAIFVIEGDQPFRAATKVLGATEISHSSEELSNNLEIPVLGLYPGVLNKVLLTLTYDKGTITDTISIATDPLPEYFPKIEINKIDRTKMEPGLHLCDMHYANNGTFESRPFIFDDQGEVRWYLNLDFFKEIIWPIQRLKNGRLLVAGLNEIHEYNMLGKLIRKSVIDEKYRIHHDIVELPSGELLMAVRKDGATIKVDGKEIPSINDFIISYNLETSQITKEWDLAKNLDVSRFDLNHTIKSDWLHMNGLAFDQRDSTVIVSGKNQGLIKISWDDELKWIMAPKKNWGRSGRDGKGFDTVAFLLTAIDSEGKPFSKEVQLGNESAADFDFPWGQHAPEVLSNGNIILFDNGWSRNYKTQITYSRAAEYKVNEEDKTVSQIWQYGKERGNEVFSLLISDVDYLPKTKNILVTPGFVANYGKIIEVTYPEGKEVFEATLYFKTLKGTKAFAWGQLDIMYRSERFELEY